jgi:hypothetical protein
VFLHHITSKIRKSVRHTHATYSPMSDCSVVYATVPHRLQTLCHVEWNVGSVFKLGTTRKESCGVFGLSHLRLRTLPSFGMWRSVAWYRSSRNLTAQRRFPEDLHILLFFGGESRKHVTAAAGCPP